MKTPFQNALFIQGDEIDYGADDALYYADHPNTIVCREFHLDAVPPAILHIAALGMYEARINGQPVSDGYLNGLWTNYQKDVYYESFDVTSSLHPGKNWIEVELGNGFYNPSPLRFFGKYNLRKNLSEVGMPKVIVDLESQGSSLLVSDASWQQKDGQLLFNNFYLGEKADLRKKEENLRAVVVNHSQRHFLPRKLEAMRKTGCVQPVSMEEGPDGILVDFGEMISGFIEVHLDGRQDQQAELFFAENMQDGKLNLFCNANGSVGEIMPDGRRVDGGPGAPKEGFEKDVLILEEGSNAFTNRFTYHSFRYVLIKGLERAQIQSIQAWYVHTDLERAGQVETDNALLNDLYDAALRTKLNNCHSTFEDCARERLGYGGDMVALADSNLYTFDVQELYKKIVRDFCNDQTERGGIPETAPFMGIGSRGPAYGEGPLMWQYAVEYLCWKLIQFYGDVEFVRSQYDCLKKHVDYVLCYDPQVLSEHCLGDHGSVLIAGEFYKPTPDKPFVGWCTILLILQTFIRISDILEMECTREKEAAASLKKTITEKFQNPDGSFADATQTSYGFAYAAGLEDPAVLAAGLARQIEADNGIFNAGIFGMKFDYDLLFDAGRSDLIVGWLEKDGQISYQNLLATGNKAFAELFFGRHYSYNHAMFTSFVQWYCQGLAGLKVAQDAVGMDRILLQPAFPDVVNAVNASLESPFGTLTSRWHREQDQILWEVQIPAGIEIVQANLPENCQMSLERTNLTN